jgi:exo-beta-1,3-glucanase (GH17 family)
VAGIINQMFAQLNWILLLCVFFVVPVLLRAYTWCQSRYRALDNGQQVGVSFITLGSILLFGLATWNHVIGPLISPWLISGEKVESLVRRYRWITYDPMGFDPFAGRRPLTASMDRDLLWIRQAGFNGIITFSSQEPFDAIPELAKRHGLGIIMGVWEPADRKEVLLAIAKKKYVDGYAVGHNGLGTRYSYKELWNAVNYIRFRTRRPVTTTERIGSYESDPRLFRIGDWVFPDAHLSLRDAKQTFPIPIFSADTNRDVHATIEYAKKITVLARTHEKMVLLKMVVYPMNGLNNASLQAQAYYFNLLLEARRDATSEMPLNIMISVHSAFDMHWKTDWPFYQWDPYTGLLEKNGTPRPAARILKERLP